VRNGAKTGEPCGDVGTAVKDALADMDRRRPIVLILPAFERAHVHAKLVCCFTDGDKTIKQSSCVLHMYPRRLAGADFFIASVTNQRLLGHHSTLRDGGISGACGNDGLIAMHRIAMTEQSYGLPRPNFFSSLSLFFAAPEVLCFAYCAFHKVSATLSSSSLNT
jgi:hypothetical protein